MCDKIDIKGINKKLTTKTLNKLNKPAEDFLTKHKTLTLNLETEFRNRLDDDSYKSVPSTFYKYTYQYIRDEGESYGRYNIWNGCKEYTILDLEKLSKDYDFFDIRRIEISNDEDNIAFSLDTKGDGLCKIYIKKYFEDKLRIININSEVINVTGPTIIKYLNTGEFCWSFNSFKLYYITVDESHRPNKLWYYNLLNDMHDCIYEEIDETYTLGLVTTDDREYVLLVSQSKTTVESYILYEYGTDSSEFPKNILKCVFKRKEGLKVFINHYANVWYITMMTDIKSEILQTRDLINFEVFIACKKNKTIQDIYLKGGYGLIRYKNTLTGLPTLGIIHLCDRTEYELSFPDKRYMIDYPTWSNLDMYEKKVVMVYQTFLQPRIWIEYNLKTKDFKIVNKIICKTYNIKNYGMKTITINKIGVVITLLHHKDWDGKLTHCVLHGYGSYGLEEDPDFNRYIPSLLDRGYIYCYAHIRGGGYYGEEWYNEGKMLKKMNTFKDYISCAEYLIKKKYTSADKLIGYGASAGGLLMGAVANMKPELFKLLIMGVPFLDVLTVICDKKEPLTTEEWKEWGNPYNKKYYDYMLKYDPIRNIDIYKNYPNIYIFSNKNDSLVGAWVPYEYYKKIKEAKVFEDGKNKVLINIKTAYGHQGSSDRYESMREIADKYTIILNSDL